ncbi:hypothetical protein F8M41_013408 [Gigaspora margarita]|uniref:Uncharacterized protein n=1 Tax=Gigaspora margarita TaxID=4874 RepID=A0A8H3WXV2_GIGMA|nr:hypothetical protein F8M41_013408 [Gigaspora margarita]
MKHNKLNIRNLKLNTTRQSQTPIRSSQSQISSQTPVHSISQPQIPVRTISSTRSILQAKASNNLLNQRNNEVQKNSETQENSKVQKNSSTQRNIDTQRNNNALRNSETQRNQFSDQETDSETFNNQYHINSDDDHESILNINSLYKRKSKFINKESKRIRSDEHYNEEAIIRSLESLHTIINTLTDTVNKIKNEQTEIYEFIKQQQKTFTSQTYSHKKQWFYRTIHKAIHEKMNTIKYPPNEQLEIVSKIALELYNKGHLDAILKNLSWKNLWNNGIAPAAKEIAREYRSEIKIKVKKALTEVFGRDRFPPIEQAHPSADQVNTWKQKNTIQSCFNDLENPKDLDDPGFTWRLAVLEQVFPDKTTKNNITFASVCIDVICDANYSEYELQQTYVIQEMNHALKGMQSDELELEADIELEANDADIELEANDANIELEANDVDIEFEANEANASYL